MTTRNIISALEDRSGGQSARLARDAARADFLEWMIALPDGANTAQEARAALAKLGALPSQSAAVRLFADYLRQACTAPKAPVRRGGIARNRGLVH